MKIQKVYEKLYKNAGIFKVKIATFFDELEEFDNIIYETEDGENFRFMILFVEIFKETVEQMEKFNDFMGFDKNGWCFKVSEKYNEIYEDFYLGEDKIEIYLKKFEMLNNAKKYNL